MRSTFVGVAVAVAVLVLGSCVDDDGPDSIEARSFVQLGSGVVDLEPLWLDDAGARASAVDTLTTAGAHDRNLEVDEAVRALEAPATEGTRPAAFVLTGCSETGAELTIEGSTIAATHRRRRERQLRHAGLLPGHLRHPGRRDPPGCASGVGRRPRTRPPATGETGADPVSRARRTGGAMMAPCSTMSRSSAPTSRPAPHSTTPS